MKLRPVLCLAVVFCCAGPAIAAARTVALSGAQAPGAPASGTFDFFHANSPGAPVIGYSGRTAFASQVVLGNVAGPVGVWSDATGTLANVAIAGGPAPGSPAGTEFSTLDAPLISEAGRTAFAGDLDDGNTGIWAQGNSGLSLIARKGIAAAGAGAGVNYLTLFTPSFSGAGKVAFRAQVSGAGVSASNNVGIWAEKSGGLTLMARTGSPAPGAPAGVLFGSFPATPIAINSPGQVAFKGFLTGTGVTNANRMGIWAERNAGLEMVARQASPVPGVASANFEFIDDPSLNRNGRVAFTALMTGVPASTNAGVFSDAGGTLALVARRGNQAPGLSAGVTFSAFADPLLNGDGEVLFYSTLGGAAGVNNNASIWSADGGALSSVAREGDQAPGAPDGHLFGDFSNWALNSAGQAAFVATLTGTGVSATSDQGIWAQGLDGRLRLVVREGGTIEVSPGVTRTVSELRFAGGFNTEDGRPVGLSDLGEVAFSAKFTDGSSGVFVSDVAKSLSGDFDGDGDFDGADFLTWQRGLGRTGNGLPNYGDANADRNVDAADLAVWKTKVTAPASVAAAAVPEPSGVLLCLLGFAIVYCRTNR